MGGRGERININHLGKKSKRRWGPEGQLGPWRKIESLNIFLPETKAQAHLKNKGGQLYSKACCAPKIGTLDSVLHTPRKQQPRVGRIL